MDISAGLVGKIAAGGTAAAATTTAGVIYGEDIAEFLGIGRAWSNDDIREKIGLECAEESGECTLVSEKVINVMESDNKKRTDIISLNFSSAKIKLNKNEKEYNKGLKFSIEGGDIALTGGTANDVTNLKNGASYEVKFFEDKWFLSQKTSSTKEQEKFDRINEKLEKLGITKEDCKFKWGGEAKPCRLNKNELKKVKFEGVEAKNLTIGERDKFDLKIREVTSTDNAFGPENFKFTFSSFSTDVTNSSNGIFLKKNINPEFKIKNGSGDSLTLEKAWTVTKLAEKIHLNCTTGTPNECNFGTNGTNINVIEGDKELTDANVKNGKITFEENQENYNQGFKYTIKETDISFNDGTTASPISSLEQDKSYEIIKKGGKWYFSKKN